jgi:hypothetical protein
VWQDTAWFTLNDAPNTIEFDWHAASSVGANDGSMAMWINGVQQVGLTGLDNDTRRIDRARLGAVAGMDPGTLGTYFFDAFESWRQTDPAPRPTPTNTPIIATNTPTSGPTAAPTNTPTATATLPVSDVIFADGFELGDLSAWTSNVNDAGDLSVSPVAALAGGQGLQVIIDDANAIHVTDDSPTAEPRYRARFYFDPNSIPMTNGDQHYIFRAFTGTTEMFRLELRFSAGLYQVRGRTLNDSGAWQDTNWFTLNDAPNIIEFDWQAANAAGANDGALTLWINEVEQVGLTGLDNDTRRIDRARLGAVAGLDAGTLGTYFFDAFESRRQTYIGP